MDRNPDTSPNQDASTPPRENSERIRGVPGFSKGVNDYLNHYITVADAKAAGLLTLDLTLIGIFKRPAYLTHPMEIIGWIGFCLLILGAVVAAFALFPRQASSGSGVIFWGDISSRTNSSDYLADVDKLDESAIEAAYATQNLYVGRTLTEKFQCVQAAMLMTGVGAACMGLSNWY